ncbi:LysR family transcriptional regulator [Paraburkholderia sp. BL25I1N1]|uniref:LysR family transcriptional regulator n=1 Tax=Paraburkholderia sp. BL25I1N1 TaxID=1938804 RepID=UPI000D0784DB|nr:LysR family transcriptional regulator [Paraburkholderia sp. BL25I1N1]PRY04454.1 DNA-binding transcriptional LysR family regulator [Paraburkholderia sp. BL25I1N1]
MDRLKALEVFKAIVEHKGFSRGADALNVSRSIATRVVQSLETELGARLFVRSTRKVSLTPFGQCFFERATAVIGSYEELAFMGKQNSTDACGSVRIDAPALFGLQRLGGMLAMFMKDNPNIDVDLHANDNGVDALSDLADLAISVDRAAPENLIARPLRPLTTGLYASQAYLDRVGVPQHPRDVAPGDWMVLAGRTTCGEFELLEHSSSNRFLTPRNGAMRANNPDALIGAAIHGAGVALVPSRFAQKAHLVPVLPGWSSRPLEVHLLYRPRRLEPMRVRKLIDYLTDEFAYDPASDYPTQESLAIHTTRAGRPMASDRLMAA